MVQLLLLLVIGKRVSKGISRVKESKGLFVMVCFKCQTCVILSGKVEVFILK